MDEPTASQISPTPTNARSVAVASERRARFPSPLPPRLRPPDDHEQRHDVTGSLQHLWRAVACTWLALTFPAATALADEPPLVLSTGAARAPAPNGDYQFQPGVLCPYCLPQSDHPEGRTGLHWHDHWESVGAREYLTIPALAAASIAISLAPRAKSPSWDSPILFDSGARELLRLNSASARRTAQQVSDILFLWEIAHPAIIDPLLIATWRRAPGVAWQISIINAQAYALTMVLNQATKRLTSRERPYVDLCDQDPTGETCSSGSRYSSFYSGHAAMTATGAGLLCAHHTQLRIYGNDTLDTGTCVAAVLGTAITGAMRVASDNHWASDVFVGHLMGYASGYLLPTLLYYKEFRIKPEANPTPSPSPTVAALPMFDGNSFQLHLVGSF
jgi:membrane-associated phospholipid phosphatase